MSSQFPRGLDGTGPYSVCSPNISDDFTGCDAICDYFATEADTMIDIVSEFYLNKDFEYLYSVGGFIKLSHLNVKLLFSICISIYFGIIRIIMKYVIKYKIIYKI